jgi:cobaltochelatase CobN
MFTPAGFRPGLQEMHDWMHDWELIVPGAVRDQLERSLKRSFAEYRLDKDLGWTPEREVFLLDYKKVIISRACAVVAVGPP